MSAIKGAGTTLAVDFAGSGSTTVVNVTSVSFSGWSRSEIDVTNLSSTSKDYLVGIPEGGEISCELFWDSEESSNVAFGTLLNSGAKRAIVITFSDDSTVSADCYLTGFDIDSGSVDDAVTASATFKITGPVTLG